MYVTPEQIQAAGKANVDSMLSLAATQFAAIEKLATLNANAVKTAFEDGLNNTRALFGAKDVQEFVNLQNSFATPRSRRPAFRKRLRSGDRTTPYVEAARSASPTGTRTSPRCWTRQ